MSSFDKYRVHEVAKDFGLASKTIVEILTKYATAPKNHMQVLEDPELSLIFESLTQRNQCATMEELFKVPEPKPEAAQAAKDRPAQQQGKQAQPAAQQPSQAQGQPAQAAQQPEGQPGQGQQEEIYGGVGGRPAQGERPGGQQAQPQQKQPGPRPGERGGSVHRQNTSQQ
mgnify:CR=1 FL=1